MGSDEVISWTVRLGKLDWAIRVVCGWVFWPILRTRLTMSLPLQPLSINCCTRKWLYSDLPRQFDLVPRASSSCLLRCSCNNSLFFLTWGAMRWSPSPRPITSSHACWTRFRNLSKHVQALLDSSIEEGRKWWLKKREGMSAVFASVGTLANQTLVLKLTSVSRCCCMIVLAIKPSPVPRIKAKRTLSLSPYKTYAEARQFAQRSSARQLASISRSYIIVSLLFAPKRLHMSLSKRMENQAQQFPSLSTRTPPKPPTQDWPWKEASVKMLHSLTVVASTFLVQHASGAGPWVSRHRQVRCPHGSKNCKHDLPDV